MSLNLVDSFMDNLDELARGWRGWTKADHSQYFPVACPQNDYALALYNGSLMSVINIDGYLGQYFPEQFKELQLKWVKFLRTVLQDKSSNGFDLFWSYEYDPEGMQEDSLKLRDNVLRAAERRGLDISDLVEEEANLYGSICAKESQYIFIVTHLDSIPKSDHGEALKSATAARRNAAKGYGSMPSKRGIGMLEAVHEQHVNKVSVFLRGAVRGYAFDRLDVYDALKAMRMSILPDTTSESWKARLTLNDCRFRQTDSVPSSLKNKQRPDSDPLDWTFTMPPTLAEQVLPNNALDLGRYAVMGGRTYAPLFVSELAQDPEPLENLLAMCYQRRLPVRIVYSLMSNSKDANYWNRMFASFFTFASSSNRQIVKADQAMKSYEENGGVIFGYGVAVSTWAPTDVRYDSKGAAHYDVSKVSKRAQDIETLMQQWGGQQLESTFGCAVEAVMSATPGFMIPPACPKAPQIEFDVIAQLPLMRPAVIWDAQNGIWMRTSDGVLLPYQPFSSKQNTMINIVLGGMGFGKSNFLSENISYFANHPDADLMPYIRGMDFGASASGVVGMIEDSLPADRKHEAIFTSFRNSADQCKNLMDTRLGMRYPLEDHKKFLVNTLVIVCDSLCKAAGISNLISVLHATIDRAYLNCDPSSHHYEFKPFIFEQADLVVQKAIEKCAFTITDDTDYWCVVDFLIENGITHNDDSLLYAAKVAQRRCVPILPDLVQVCDQLSMQFKEMPLVNGKDLTAAVANALMSANQSFPVFSSYTAKDYTESRICVIDMTEAFGRGETAYDAWCRSVLFAVVHRLLTEDLFINQAISGAEMIENQAHFGMSDKLLAWHLAYLEKQDQLLKLYLADELHRVSRVEGAFQIIDSMGFEGRKYRAGLLLGTQLIEYMPESIISLSTSVFIFGTSQSSEIAKKLQEKFDLSDDERQIAQGITKPDVKKGAEVFVIHKTSAGIQRAKLHFQVGSIKRWAYATEPNERALRGLLYKDSRGQSWARKVLAEKVPDLDAAIKSKQKARPEVSQNDAIALIADDLKRS